MFPFTGLTVCPLVTDTEGADNLVKKKFAREESYGALPRAR